MASAPVTTAALTVAARRVGWQRGRWVGRETRRLST